MKSQGKNILDALSAAAHVPTLLQKQTSQKCKRQRKANEKQYNMKHSHSHLSGEKDKVLSACGTNLKGIPTCKRKRAAASLKHDW